MFLAKLRLLKYRKYKAGVIIYAKLSDWFVKRKIRRRIEKWNSIIIQRFVRGWLGKRRHNRLKKWADAMRPLKRVVK